MSELEIVIVSAAFFGGALLAWLVQLPGKHARQVQLATLENQLENAAKENTQRESLLSDHAAIQNDYQRSQQQVVALTTKLEAERKHYEEKLALLNDAKESLRKEFENLAHRIFDDKQEKFQSQSKQRLDSVINPLRDQLQNFHKKVEDVYDKESKERSSLIGEIKILKDLNQQISQDAINLTNALKGDNKAQGNWGELVLESILEKSGLVKGREYETQVALKDEEGKRRNPDVIVRLPEGKDIIVDAKMALVDYDRYCAADSEEEKQQALKGHTQAIKNHIKGLSAKEYENLEGIRTLDFVLLFIPIEAAFMIAVEHEPSLFQDAFDQGIIVVSPTTLLATLRTVQSIWRYEKQNKNAEQIATEAGKLFDQFVLVTESLSEVGKHIERAQGSYDETVKRLRTGRGNLVGRTEKLQKLGAKTKKQLSAEFQSDDNEEKTALLETVDE